MQKNEWTEFRDYIYEHEEEAMTRWDQLMHSTKRTDVIEAYFDAQQTMIETFHRRILENKPIKRHKSNLYITK